LRYGIAEYEFRSDDQELGKRDQWKLKCGSGLSPYFWGEALEQARRAFVLEEVFHDGNAADLVLEVGILDTGLDDV